jgi:hypothetical protein
VLAVATLLGVSTSSAAAGPCQLVLKPETDGFFLNPILKKVVVHDITPGTDGSPCQFLTGDEIVQINAQPVVGQRAKTVMAHWKGLKKADLRVFRIRRGGRMMDIRLP